MKTFYATNPSAVTSCLGNPTVFFFVFFRFEKNGKSGLSWFKYSLFSPLLGEMIQFDSYFSDGLVQPPSSGEFVNPCVFLIQRPPTKKDTTRGF